jgi:hypothetical protein
LIDPLTNKVRYVGQTRKFDLSKRLCEHISRSKERNNLHISNWIRQLKKLNLKPLIWKVIDLENQEEADYTERFLIDWFKEHGYSLVNLTEGGDYPPDTTGRRLSLEHRAKISKAMKGKNHFRRKGIPVSEEARKKIGDALRGKPKSIEARMNMSRGARERAIEGWKSRRTRECLL